MADLTIASGATTSDSIEIVKGSRWGVIQLPTIDVGTVQWQVSSDDSTFVDVYDSLGVIVIIASSTGARACAMPAGVLAARYFRVVAASQAGGARTIPVTFSNE